ncbi:MAG: hypothetical protein RSA49_04515 [Anaerovoracaceae bacterium]
MKNFIVTISILGVLAILVTFQGDMNKLIRESNYLQELSNEMSMVISKKIDIEKYGEGDICFLEKEAKSVIEMLAENINNKYWTGGAEINVSLVSEDDYNTLEKIIMNKDKTLTEHINQPNKLNVTSPTVETIIEAYSPNFSLSFLKNINLKVCKKSTTEYQGHST